MEIDENVKATNYLHTLNEDKHYFGGYLNLAENNIQLVFKLFRKRFDCGNAKLEFIIKESFNDKIAITDYQRRVDFLKQYFPVVVYIDLPPTNPLFNKIKNQDKECKRRDYFRTSFTCLIKAVKYLRNFYTHYYHEPICFDESFYELLDRLLLSVINDVKKHKLKVDQTRHLLKKDLNDELKQLIEQKTAFLVEKKKRGKEVDLSPEAIENSVLNDAFSHFLDGDNLCSYYQSKCNRGQDIENHVVISECGLLFLLSMFLYRNENETLRANIKGYKAKIVKDETKPIDRKNNSLKYMATHWTFNYLSAKKVKKRLNTTFLKETLILQIADELSKVPDELYQTYTEDTKNKFIVDVNEYFKDNEELRSFDNMMVSHPVIRKRYEDKFNYFVLRYLDEFIDFPSLRFQVHLGNYVHDRREKNMQSVHVKTDRIIKEKINAFGRLSELTDIKTGFFSNLKEDTKWELFPNPSYNFVGNNIPIYINLERCKVKKPSENISSNESKIRKRIDGKLTKDQIVHKLGRDIIWGKPTALLSLNELPALLYKVKQEIENEKSRIEIGKKIENLLLNTIIKKYQAIDKFETGDKVPVSKITKRLRRAKDVEDIQMGKLRNDIEKEIDICNVKLKLIATNRRELSLKHGINEKQGKFIFTSKELGCEAAWLADDLKRFMPKGTKFNWKGYQHSQLQQSLAFYDLRPNEAYNFLKEYWDFDDENYFINLWIRKAFRSNKFDEFYEKYLNNRKLFFENISNQIGGLSKKLVNKFIEQQYLWNIFYKRLYLIPSTEKQKEELLNQPIVFSRGIFDEKPSYIKGKSLEESPELYADWYRFIQDDNHQLQKFYYWERDYKELFEVHRNSEYMEENKYELSPKQQFELFTRKWNKKIKKVAGQDLFLHLILKDVLKELFAQEIPLQLKNFYLTQEERAAMQIEADRMNKRGEGDKSPNFVNEDFIWNMKVPFKSKQINDPAVKIKDLGKFVRFLEDEKVQRIFDYDGEKEWTKEALEMELESYEKVRRFRIFKTLQELERRILQKRGGNGVEYPEELLNGRNPNFKKCMVTGLLKYHTDVSIKDLDWLSELSKNAFESSETFELLKTKSQIVQDSFILIYIRNKFSHNQLPVKQYLEMIYNCNYYWSTYAEGIAKFVEELTNKFINILDS